LDLRRIPSAVLVALGLEACVEGEVSACLSMALTTEGDAEGSGPSGTESGSSSSADDSDVGPCLGQLPTTESTSEGTTGTDTSTGDSGSSDSGTTGTGTDDGADTSTSVCLAPPPDDALPEPGEVVTTAPTRAVDWQAAFDRIAAKLPADVAARLGRRNPGGGT